MTILVPALAAAFAAFCVWLGVRIYNRREKWAMWMAASIAPFVVYASAYWVMMQPRLIFWRPHGGFGAGEIAKPEYRWWKNCRLARPQRAWQVFFTPLFTIHRHVDPNWVHFRPSANRTLQEVSDEEAYEELEAETAWPADDYVRVNFETRNQKYLLQPIFTRRPAKSARDKR